jgi:nitrite reductase/ring-hydroxylating ferredoxin subunit
MSTEQLSIEAAIEGWHALGTVDDFFGPRNCRSLTVAGVAVGFFRVDGRIYAIDDICSHGNARLSEGEIEGFEVECPLHGGVFDLRNGKALTAPLSRDVRSHPLQVVDGVLLIQLAR